MDDIFSAVVDASVGVCIASGSMPGLMVACFEMLPMDSAEWVFTSRSYKGC